MSKNKLVAKLKNDRGARAMAVTVAIMALVLIAIVVVTVVANRTVNEEPLPRIDTTPAAVTDLTEDRDEIETVTPPKTSSPQTPCPNVFFCPCTACCKRSTAPTCRSFRRP